MPFDGGKLEKIIYNLVANAIKYTPVSGQVVVTVSLVPKAAAAETDGVEITVQDTGMGISAEHLPFIFDRYYRVPVTPNHPEEGTGIGLAIVQELIQLHQGEVTVKSKPGVGTTFIFHLPLTRPLAPELPLTEAPPVTLAYSPEIAQLAQMPLVEETLAIPAEINQPKQLVLIVEDHAAMRAYIREILQPFYQVLEADNGVAGLQIARESIPDIIICDVMMPQMDGQTFCILIKQEERTSHIPVILLTAKASPEHRLEGLQTGADVYLTKPFNARELLLHLKNLLTLRQKIIAQFCDNAAAPLTEATDNPADKTFLERFTAIVMANVSNDKFGVEDLLTQLGMSRTQLHRKVTAVTGQSAGILIRLIRLQRALELLQQGELTVAEVAHQTGFASPSNFTQNFHKHFGYPPSEARRRLG